jgi:hypothetical protein
MPGRKVNAMALCLYASRQAACGGPEWVAGRSFY